MAMHDVIRLIVAVPTWRESKSNILARNQLLIAGNIPDIDACILNGKIFYATFCVFRRGCL